MFRERHLILFLSLLLLLSGCGNDKKKSVIKPLTSEIKKEHFVAKTEADEIQYGRHDKYADSIRAAEEAARLRKQTPKEKNKTIVIESETIIFGEKYHRHFELKPDGIVKGKGYFYDAESWSSYSTTFTGAWRTGSIPRGTTSIMYYEIDVNDSEWYFTEFLDYIWLGESAYSAMRSNDMNKASKIVKHYEK